MLRGVVFDLDGTITKPFLDFVKIRDEIGLNTTRLSLLEALSVMSPEEHERASAILREHEIEAARNAELNDGIAEVQAFILAHRLRSGIITRNCDESTFLILKKLEVRMEAVITRDSGLPPKPSPEPLLEICSRWSLNPKEVVMIGDHDFDIQTGKAAGARTIYLTNGQAQQHVPAADHVILTARELPTLLESLLHE
jgi:HAD superfamily hydrolase (TIGR01549 family)